jgi:hypothetical protein
MAVGSPAGDATWVLEADFNSRSLVWSDLAEGVTPTVTLPLPFDRPGSLCWLGDYAFLISGFDVTTSNGYLQVVRLVDGSPRSIAVERSVVLPGFDPASILWRADEDLLYVQEFTTDSIMAAPWSSNVPGLPTKEQFVRLAVLSDAGSSLYRLFLPREGGGIALRRRIPTSSDFMTKSWRVFIDSQGVQVVDMTNQDPPLPMLGLGPGSSTRHPIWMGGAATNVELVNLQDDLVVWTGSLTAPEFAPIVVPEGAMTPGASYQLRDALASARSSVPVTVNSRWGIPAPGVGTRLEIVPDPTYQPTRGDADSAAITGRVLWRDPTVRDSASLPVWMWLGTRTTDPVVYLPNGQAILRDPLVVMGPQTIALSPVPDPVGPPSLSRPQGSYAFELPIPDDPIVDGLEYIIQIATVDSEAGEIVVSDVFGTILFPPAGQTPTPRSSGGSAIDEERSPLDALRAVLPRDCQDGRAVWEQCIEQAKSDASLQETSPGN